MLDLNHGSGCQYQKPDRDPGITIAVNAAIDAALVVRNREQAARQEARGLGQMGQGIGQAGIARIAMDQTGGGEMLVRPGSGIAAEDVEQLWRQMAHHDRQGAAVAAFHGAGTQSGCGSAHPMGNAGGFAQEGQDAGQVGGESLAGIKKAQIGPGGGGAQPVQAGLGRQPPMLGLGLGDGEGRLTHGLPFP